MGITLFMLGRHNIYNALSAAATALLFNFDLEDVKAGLEKFEPFKMRSELRLLNSGLRIINDSYNANPASMEAAIMLLSNFKTAEGHSQFSAICLSLETMLKMRT